MAYHPNVEKLDDEGLVRAMVRVTHDDLYPKLDVTCEQSTFGC